MATKLDYYSYMAEETTKNLTKDKNTWTSFLQTAGRINKYAFEDQVMIYAQKPEATACAEYDLWNSTMRRFVKRGAKGIALIDNSGDYPKLHYVFDVSDTGERKNSRHVNLWQMKEEYAPAMQTALEAVFGVSAKDSLDVQLENIAMWRVIEYWMDHEEELGDIVADSFLEAYDEDNRRMSFVDAATVSIKYQLLSRITEHPDEYFEADEFAPVFDFNTRKSINALGTAVSQIAEEIFREIEITTRNYERNKRAERSQSYDKHINLHTGRGLSDSQHHTEGNREDAAGQVRQDAQDISAGAQADSLQRPVHDGEAVSPLKGDRSDGTRASGSVDETALGEASGAGQDEKSDGMGAAHEQPESDGRGNRTDGAGVQLSEEIANEPVFQQLSFLFPTEAEQIKSIDMAESEMPSVFSFAQEDIDHVLRMAGSSDNRRMVVAAEYMKGKFGDELIAFLKDEYRGGIGLLTDNGRMSAWCEEDGIHLGRDDRARNAATAQVFSWEAVADRIGELLDMGQFATNVELAEAQGYARTRLSQSIWYLRQDFSDIAKELLLLPTLQSYRGGGFPEETARLAEALANPEILAQLTFEMESFADVYRQEPNILRFHFHKIPAILQQLKELAQPWKEYTTDMMTVPPVGRFITEDEIDHVLTSGSGVSGGKGRIYAYFNENHTSKEQAEFLKNEYGTGGRGGHVFPNDFHSGESHDAKGMKLEKAGCASISLSWSTVARRVESLVKQGQYLRAEELEKLNAVKHADVKQEDFLQQAKDLIDEYCVQEYGEPADFSDITHVGVGFTTLSNESVANQDIPIEAVVDLVDCRLQRYLNDKVFETREYDSLEELIHNELEHLDFYELTSLEDDELEALLDGDDWQASQDATSRQFDEKLGDGTTSDQVDPKLEDGRTSVQNEQKSEENVTSAQVEHKLEDNATSAQIERKSADETTSRPVVEKLEGEATSGPVDQKLEADETYRHDVDKLETPEPSLSDDQLWAQENLIPGETTFNLGDRIFMVDRVNLDFESVNLQDITFANAVGFPIFRTEPISRVRQWIEAEPVKLHSVVMELNPEPESQPEIIVADNYRITDNHLGEGGPKLKYAYNVAAIRTLQTLEAENRNATPEEQEILSKYVGWGSLSDAFDANKPAWAQEYLELKGLLSEEEYAAARASTLNAHYTSPTIIHAIYDAVEQMGFQSGNILEPSMGVGNFFGLLPDNLSESRLYGVELDSLSGRIAQKLYPKAEITVGGFETTDRRDFYDLAVGNVPFGDYKVNDKPYNKLGFSIHNYFFAKALDQVRPGGVVAFVTSRYTMDAKSPDVRKYLAQRAELLGAIRLPNNAFRANAGTEVVSDILFLQKRETPIDIEPDWVHLGLTPDGHAINSYFIDHPHMVLGELATETTQYGREEITVKPLPEISLAEQLKEAVTYVGGHYEPVELMPDDELSATQDVIAADPNVKNFSFTAVDGEVYFRENSVMRHMELNETAKKRALGMISLRQTLNELIAYQLEDYPDADIAAKQQELEAAYDAFTETYGLINSRANERVFADDSSYYLLCSLEDVDDEGNLKGKADMFTKRTIRSDRTVTSVDTPVEALAVSIGERGVVDLPYMAELLGTPEEYDRITEELAGVIFKNPMETVDGDVTKGWQTADEYLSGNVREKLRIAKMAAKNDPSYAVNVQALEKAQPKDLDASEIDVRLGATWLDKNYIQRFMEETFEPPFYMRRNIKVNFAPQTAEWQISGKTMPNRHDVNAYVTYGTDRANAYRILEETLNLKDIRIYDTVEDADGKQKRVLNKKETTLAQQKQQAIKDAFRDWVWKDPQRREVLCQRYNELFNSTRPREYDGSHIHFVGMNPEIHLREHQKNAIAHVLYGGNTLLAHEVGAGKTFEMAASAMESKRLGLCQKSLFVVPNHLTTQWANEFLRLYPSAKLLVATRKDFETVRRKKFCARIATGDYDAIIIGHSQFEKIPVSAERQERQLREQIDEIEDAIASMKYMRGENFTIKQMEKTRRSLQAKLDKLMSTERKDDVVTFEQLGVDRLFIDESHAYKNLFLYTKMRNVAGLSTSEAQKSSDMFMKCRYMDELTGGRGVIFATGTPVSNSMTELYTVMRYLQYSTLQQKNLTHFDCWASTFGETTTAIELAPEGTGYRARTRFSKFFNLPELMNMFKEVADIKTSDQLDLPVPEARFETVLVQPSELQKDMVQSLSERAAKVHSGMVDASEDNMLCITSDGRKIGLDQRLMNPLLPDDEGSKLNACVNNVYRIWEDGAPEKLTQLLFCDMSTPKGDGTFNVYDDIKSKLVARGVPEEEVAFIHDADTEAKKKELFAKVRSGQVRVLLGSTQKMGAGTNVQDRLVAVHHLDVGWRPSDMTQRNGRIIRQNNMNKEVQIYNYVTEGTFDAYLYQTLENKQRFISQIMTSKSPVRSCDDVDEQALSYAEIKALCAGSPLIKEKMDLDIDVARLKVLKADHRSKQYRMEDQLLKYFPVEIERQQSNIEGFRADIRTAESHPHPADGFAGMTVAGKHYSEKADAGEAILAVCKTAKAVEGYPLGKYRGFDMVLSFDSFDKEFVISLKGAMSHRVPIGSDARGNLTRLDNALTHIPAKLEQAQNKLEALEQQQETARVEIKKPFSQEAELAEKSARLAELDAMLNMDENHDMTQGDEERGSVLADLKEKAGQVMPPSRHDGRHSEEVL